MLGVFCFFFGVVLYFLSRLLRPPSVKSYSFSRYLQTSVLEWPLHPPWVHFGLTFLGKGIYTTLMYSLWWNLWQHTSFWISTLESTKGFHLFCFIWHHNNLEWHWAGVITLQMRLWCRGANAQREQVTQHASGRDGSLSQDPSCMCHAHGDTFGRREQCRPAL